MSRVSSALVALAGAATALALSTPGASAGPFPASTAQAATNSPAVAPVLVGGEGSDDPFQEMTRWEAELFGNTGSLSMSYIVDGGFGARQIYLNGIGDYVISASPFTSAELAKLPPGNRQFISAPVMVSAVSFLLAWGPVITLHRSCASSDHACRSTSTYDGPVDVPSTELTDMLWPDLAANGAGSCGCFGADPAIAQATSASLSQGDDTAPPYVTFPQNTNQPLAVFRSEPSETNYYAQKFAAAAAPEEWSKVPHFSPPITEFLQGESTNKNFTTNEGVESQLSYATSTSTLSGASAASHNGDGVVVAVPPSALTGLGYYTPRGQTAAATPPTPTPVWIRVQNASGQYVAPSPESIDAAVRAGGGTPLYALSHPVGGSIPAYPLTYVDNLYAPAHGLSADKTEAIATIVRYMATAGQDATASYGDGRLSAPMRTQSLAAANQLVASNCTGSTGQVVVSSDIGPYAPAVGPLGGKTAAQRQQELQAIGPMLHCVGAPSSSPPTSGNPGSTSTGASTATTTFVPSSAGVPTGSRSPGGGSSAPGGPVSPGSRGPGSAALATPGGVNQASSSPSLANLGSGLTGAATRFGLPLPIPGLGPAGFDRLASMALGGLLFLALWKGRHSLARLLRP